MGAVGDPGICAYVHLGSRRDNQWPVVMNVASGCSAQDFELNLIDHACSVQLAKAAVCESPSVVTPPTPACSVPTQTYGKGLVCDVSVCEEHTAGQADDDCCGSATFCPAEYTKSKVLTSRVDATWLNAPAGFSRTCPNIVPYGGNTCCTPPPPPPPPPLVGQGGNTFFVTPL